MLICFLAFVESVQLFHDKNCCWSAGGFLFFYFPLTETLFLFIWTNDLILHSNHLRNKTWKILSLFLTSKMEFFFNVLLENNSIFMSFPLFSLQSELEIEPRYPLFGGWKATFVIGYGLPLQDFLFESSDGRRYLNFSFGCPLADTVVDKLTIKVGTVL
ncbi:hypothetical protein CsSME_00000569 [Camellia sinensis var. sinensis]